MHIVHGKLLMVSHLFDKIDKVMIVVDKLNLTVVKVSIIAAGGLNCLKENIRRRQVNIGRETVNRDCSLVATTMCARVKLFEYSTDTHADSFDKSNFDRQKQADTRVYSFISLYLKMLHEIT